MFTQEITPSQQDIANLFGSISEERIDLIEVWIGRFGAKAIKTTYSYETPLNWAVKCAAKRQNYETLYYLLSHIQKLPIESQETILNAKNERLEYTPLHQAAELRDLSSLKLLLQTGANPNVPAKYGDTPRDILNNPLYSNEAVTQYDILVSHRIEPKQVNPNLIETMPLENSSPLSETLSHRGHHPKSRSGSDPKPSDPQTENSETSVDESIHPVQPNGWGFSFSRLLEKMGILRSSHSYSPVKVVTTYSTENSTPNNRI